MQTLLVGGHDHLFLCELDATTLVERARWDVGVVPSFVAFAPARGTAYVVNEGGDAVVALGLGRAAFAEGRIVAAPERLGAVPSPGGPAYVAVDRSERWVFAANYGGGSVLVWPILEDGSLGGAVAEVHTGVHPHCIVTDPTNRRVFVPNLGSDATRVFDFDAASGQLVASAPASLESVAGAGPRHLAFHPRAALAYLVHELDCTLSVVDWSEGARVVQTLSTLDRPREAGDTGADVHVSPDGRFVYVSNRGRDSIAVFRVTPAGLEPAGAYACGGRVPRNFCLLGDDRLLVANQESPCVSVFRRDPGSGALEQLSSITFEERVFWVGPLGLKAGA